MPIVTLTHSLHRREKAQEEAIKHQAEPYVPKHDLTLKQGQTFTLNLKVRMHVFIDSWFSSCCRPRRRMTTRKATQRNQHRRSKFPLQV